MNKVKKFVQGKPLPIYVPLSRTINHMLREVFSKEFTSVKVGNSDSKFLLENSRMYDLYLSKGLDGEYKVIKDQIEEIDKNDIYWDIGSEYGTYALLVGKNAAKAYAFEPDPLHSNTLMDNVKLNESSINVFPLALGNNSSFLSLDRQDSYSTQLGEDNKAAQIPIIDAKTLIESFNIEIPSMIKIDVEGAGMDVIEGFGENIREIRIIYIEIHPEAMNKREKEVQKYLQNKGFNVENIYERGSQQYLKATNKDS